MQLYFVNRALIELGETGAQNVMYEMLSTFVHIANSYEMQELHTEFAKHHIQEEEVTSALVSIRLKGVAQW